MTGPAGEPVRQVPARSSAVQPMGRLSESAGHRRPSTNLPYTRRPQQCSVRHSSCPPTASVCCWNHASIRRNRRATIPAVAIGTAQGIQSSTETSGLNGDCGEFPQQRWRALSQISTTPACEQRRKRLPSRPGIARHPRISDKTAMLSNGSRRAPKIQAVDSSLTLVVLKRLVVALSLLLFKMGKFHRMIESCHLTPQWNGRRVL